MVDKVTHLLKAPDTQATNGSVNIIPGLSGLIITAMTNRIDKIFSPDRLQQSWNENKETKKNQSKKQDNISTPAAGPAQNVYAEYERLQVLINKRFSEEDRLTLNELMKELKVLITQRFPETKDKDVFDDEKANLDKIILEVLDHIEDLIEALALT